MALAASLVFAGDEFQTPTLRGGSGYESAEPKYHVVGIEDRGVEATVWVVADPAIVTTQVGVNRIIKDIQQRLRTDNGSPGFTEIWFYSSVRGQPQAPAFRIFDHLAVYRFDENKTHYGVGAKELYGGWAHGPRP